MAIRYRSTGALVYGGLWDVVVGGFGVWLIVGGELILGVWFVGMVVMGLWWTSLQVTVTADGEMCFVGALRRRQWSVSELRTIRPGSGGMVFRFESGRAMLAGGGHGDEWTALLGRLVELNPSALVGLPRDSDTSGARTASANLATKPVPTTQPGRVIDL